MNLYLVHCGYYDPEICDSAFESHVNFFVAADSFEEAKNKAKLLPIVQNKKMHVDGLQEIAAVDGYKIFLERDATLSGETLIATNRHRELAPKKAPTES